MKIYTIMISLAFHTAISAMNPNTTASTTPQTLQFDHSNIIIKKLTMHDKNNKTNYRVIAQATGFHFILASKPHPISQVEKLLRTCIKEYNPKMPAHEILHHSNQIKQILCSNEAPSTKSKL